MKSATFPSIRVEPELRDAAESVLREGETLSGFVEQSIREGIERRRNQSEFIARGIVSREAARRTGDYLPASEVLDKLERAARRPSRYEAETWVTYAVRFTRAASDDLDRLYGFVGDRDDVDVELATRTLTAIAAGIATLESSPFTCRKAHPSMPLPREVIIPFGASGYVAMFEIDDNRTVTILAVRHQRESDYH